MKNTSADTKPERTTTADTFAVMRKEIANYSQRNSLGKSKKTLCSEYCVCTEILKTLTKRDLLMIWHLRNGFAGMSGNFARAAKRQYKVKKEIEHLNL